MLLRCLNGQKRAPWSRGATTNLQYLAPVKHVVQPGLLELQKAIAASRSRVSRGRQLLQSHEQQEATATHRVLSPATRDSLCARTTVVACTGFRDIDAARQAKVFYPQTIQATQK